MSMPKLTPMVEVNKRLFLCHGDSVVMDQSTYTGLHNNATFIHKIYGPFIARVARVLKGSSHKKEANLKISKSKRLSIKNIRDRLFEVHGDTISIIENTYVQTSKKCTLIHKTYGPWEAFLSNVLRGSSHPKAFAEDLKIPLCEIKDRIRNIHGDTVVLVESSYNGLRKPATFVHKTYGPWTAEAITVINYGATHRKEANFKLRSKQFEVEEQIKRIHGNSTKIIWNSYSGQKADATFVHCKYGEFIAKPADVLSGCGPKIGRTDKRIATNFKKYGVDHVSQNTEIGLKIAKRTNTSKLIMHWKTGEELVCVGSYEAKTVNYLNLNKINYLWQPTTFKMPIGKTYRPDLYLEDQDKWVEIKGYFRKDALEKWNWFQSEYPNSELWDQKKLKELGIL